VSLADRIDDLLAMALERAALCSNDPFCASHDPNSPLEKRYAHGAACHGCLLIAETSCERRRLHGCALMAEAFPNLSIAELETLLAALDPHRDDSHCGDPGALAADLADPPAFLARIGLATGPGSLGAWLEQWRASGGGKEALLLSIEALLDQRRSDAAARRRTSGNNCDRLIQQSLLRGVG